MAEADPERKNEAGKDLIRARFGKGFGSISLHV
jgi:hypothetical protein